MTLEELKLQLERSIKTYENNNEDMIKEIDLGEFYGIDYFGGNVDDAFVSGSDYGEYITNLSILGNLS